MSYPQKLGALWWTKNIRYTIYFLRELTGPIIAGYVLYLLIGVWAQPKPLFQHIPGFAAISWMALIASILHSITWFWVTIKISPIQLSRLLHALAFAGLLAGWLLLSYLLIYVDFFYQSF